VVTQIYTEALLDVVLVLKRINDRGMNVNMVKTFQRMKWLVSCAMPKMNELIGRIK